MNDITVVATAGGPPFDLFETKGPGVHLMEEDTAREIAKIRAG
jgi:hypothetical protein